MPLLNNRTPEEFLDPKSFDFVLIDDSFCVRHKAVKPDNNPPISIGHDEGYYYNQTSLVIPRHMYRLKDLTSDTTMGGELAVQAAGDYVRVPLIVEGQVEKVEDQKGHFFSSKHHCCDVKALTGGKTGGGVCGIKLGSPYVAEIWKWEKLYPAGKGSDMRQLVHHYLQGRFKLKSEVAMVQLILPDFNIVRIPLLTPIEIDNAHEKLMAASEETVFGIDNLVLLDGPDIFLGTCDFEPIG